MHDVACEFACAVKVRIHGAILRAMAKLHRVSTPKIVARNIAAVERSGYTVQYCAQWLNCIVYTPLKLLRAILCAILQQ